MPNIKEIRMKIDSVRNIQKIAKAMEMIAASKMNKTKQLMLLSRPYSESIRKVINHVSSGALEYKHSYFIKRKVKSVGYWIVSTDRGLVGGLNINLFRILLYDIYKWNNIGVSTKLAVIGSKASIFFKNISTEIVSYIFGMGDSPKMLELIGSVRILSHLYDNNAVDRLFLVYNRFVNTLVQIPTIMQILPILPINNSSSLLKKNSWDYLYEPDSKILLNFLLKRYVESQVYQGVVENLASEQSARMIAMKTASDNGEVLIDDLKLFYNKIRQSKITQELSEIVSGVFS